MIPTLLQALSCCDSYIITGTLLLWFLITGTLLLWFRHYYRHTPAVIPTLLQALSCGDSYIITGTLVLWFRHYYRHTPAVIPTLLQALLCCDSDIITGTIISMLSAGTWRQVLSQHTLMQNTDTGNISAHFDAEHWHRYNLSHRSSLHLYTETGIISTPIIIIIIIALKGAIWDFLQSPHCATNCFQHVRESGQKTTVCKPCSTHWALVMCNILCVTGYKGTAQLLSLTQSIY